MPVRALSASRRAGSAAAAAAHGRHRARSHAEATRPPHAVSCGARVDRRAARNRSTRAIRGLCSETPSRRAGSRVLSLPSPRRARVSAAPPAQRLPPAARPGSGAPGSPLCGKVSAPVQRCQTPVTRHTPPAPLRAAATLIMAPAEPAAAPRQSRRDLPDMAAAAGRHRGPSGGGSTGGAAVNAVPLTHTYTRTAREPGGGPPRGAVRTTRGSLPRARADRARLRRRPRRGARKMASRCPGRAWRAGRRPTWRGGAGPAPAARGRTGTAGTGRDGKGRLGRAGGRRGADGARLSPAD